MASAIVTGAASGIGLALAAALVERGDDVAMADIDGEAVEEAAARLGRAGPGSAEPAELDVADAEAVRQLVHGVHQRRGLDLLFNNAGIGTGGEPEELTLEHWDRTIDVNLRGVIHGCHAAYPLMVEQGRGHIVNTASLAGLVGGFGVAAPYATTKFAVVGLSLALHVTGADHGVQVHVVCPGGVDTPLIDRDHVPGLVTPPSMRGVTVRSMADDSPVRTSFIPPERLARDVLRGIERGRPIIVAPSSARFVWRLFRAMPGPMLRGSVLGTRHMRRQRPTATANP